MTRAGPGLQTSPTGGCREKLALLIIEPIYHHPVETEIRCVRIPAGRVEDNGVCMRPLLPGLHARSLVLNDIGCPPEAPVTADRQNRETASRVVGHQHESPGRIDRKVARIGTMRRTPVQQPQVAGLWIHGKRAHRTARLPFELGSFVHTEEPTSISVDHKKRWVGDTFCHGFDSQIPRSDIKKAAVYPLAFAVRVCTDEKSLTAGNCREPRSGKESAGCDATGNPNAERFEKITSRDFKVHSYPRLLL